MAVSRSEHEREAMREREALGAEYTPLLFQGCQQKCRRGLLSRELKSPVGEREQVCNKFSGAEGTEWRETFTIMFTESHRRCGNNQVNVHFAVTLQKCLVIITVSICWVVRSSTGGSAYLLRGWICAARTWISQSVFPHLLLKPLLWGRYVSLLQTRSQGTDRSTVLPRYT